jgi:hypothetical protein
MANADMNRLMDNVRIKTPGAIDTVINLELFNVLNDFFQNSDIWTEEITIDVVPSAQTYFENPDPFTFEILPLEGGVINRLKGVRDASGQPWAATMATPGVVILSQLPSDAATFTVVVAKTVTDPVRKDGTPECPDWVINKYGNGLQKGVIGNLQAQIAKPYSSPAMALANLRAFGQTTSQAKTEALHANVYGGQTWRFPQGFASRGQRKR